MNEEHIKIELFFQWNHPDNPPTQTMPVTTRAQAKHIATESMPSAHVNLNQYSKTMIRQRNIERLKSKMQKHTDFQDDMHSVVDIVNERLTQATRYRRIIVDKIIHKWRLKHSLVHYKSPFPHPTQPTILHMVLTCDAYLWLLDIANHDYANSIKHYHALCNLVDNHDALMVRSNVHAENIVNNGYKVIRKIVASMSDFIQRNFANVIRGWMNSKMDTNGEDVIEFIDALQHVVNTPSSWLELPVMMRVRKLCNEFKRVHALNYHDIYLQEAFHNAYFLENVLSNPAIVDTNTITTILRSFCELSPWCNDPDETIAKLVAVTIPNLFWKVLNNIVVDSDEEDDCNNMDAMHDNYLASPGFLACKQWLDSQDSTKEKEKGEETENVHIYFEEETHTL